VLSCTLLRFKAEHYAEKNNSSCVSVNFKVKQKKSHFYLYQFLFFCAMLHNCDLVEVTHENMHMADKINAIYH